MARATDTGEISSPPPQAEDARDMDVYETGIDREITSTATITVKGRNRLRATSSASVVSQSRRVRSA